MSAFRNIFYGLLVKAKSALTGTELGSLETLTGNSKLHFHNGTTSSPVVTEAHTATLTNKSIDADTNTVTNIDNADIKAGAAIARDKLASGTAYRLVANDVSGVQSDAAAITASRALQSDANGLPTHSSVTSTELGYVSGVSSAIQTQLNTVSTGLSDHLVDAVDAHDASAISNIPSGNLSATDVQGALNELQTDVDSRVSAAALTAHTSASSGVHGVSGSVVGTTDNQTLTNKVIDGDDNTVQDLPLSSIKTVGANTNRVITRNGSGAVVDTIASPTGAFVGTTDTQILTNKTINGADGDFLEFNSQGGDPATPSGSGDVRVYSKSGLIYSKDSTGTVRQIGNPVVWTNVTGTSQAMSVNNGYISDNAAIVTLTLPSTAAVGDIIYIVGKGAGGWRVAQNSGQTIVVDTQTTPSGISGFIQSATPTTTMVLVCQVANTTFQVLEVYGSLVLENGYPGTTNGYVLGGVTGGSDAVTNIGKFIITSETASNLGNSLSTASSLQGSASSTLKGYVFGGRDAADSSINTIGALTFSAETTSNISATLTSAIQRGTGLTSVVNNKGYLAGGFTSGVGSPVASIYALAFSGETLSTLSATLPGAKWQAGGMISSTKGYAVGGNDGVGGVTTIHALTYNTEATSTLGATMNLSDQYDYNATSSSSAGYTLGGNSTTQIIQQLVFGTEVLSTLGATMPAAARSGGPISAASKGYLLGGNVSAGTPDTTIQALTYGGLTTAIISATLATAKFGSSGVQY